jgi:FolB domain-containing protein
VSLELELPLAAAGASDSLQHSVDYDQLSQDVMRRAREARRLTLEALAEDLAQLCLQRDEVERVTVRVDKPGAVRQARSVAVRITRGRDPRASGH